MEATDKTSKLLTSMNNFPRGMIENFANADQEATRAMFIILYDESEDVYERIEKFNFDAEILKIKYSQYRYIRDINKK